MLLSPSLFSQPKGKEILAGKNSGSRPLRATTFWGHPEVVSKDINPERTRINCQVPCILSDLQDTKLESNWDYPLRLWGKILKGN